MTYCSSACFPFWPLGFLFSFTFSFLFFLFFLCLDLLTSSLTFHCDHEHISYIHVVESLAQPGICFLFFTLTPPSSFLRLPSPISTHSYTLGTSIPMLPSIPRYLTNLVIGVHDTFHRNQKKIAHINMANHQGSRITETCDNRYLRFRVGTGNLMQQHAKLLTGQ